jgi:SAM-dependent methyltransferase
MECVACHETAGRDHRFREMMVGTRQEFAYWECLACGCLQIVAVPENMSAYYPSDYYSFALRAAAWKGWYYRSYFAAPRLMKALRRCSPDFASVIGSKPRPGARILDVGCGGGELVGILRILGFEAFGIDPHVRTSTPFVQRASLDDVQGDWDMVMFHHSLEHMVDHAEVLRSVRSKLKQGGLCLVRIPVATWAWKHYGRDWVQLDAPRHFVVHTPRSFELTAEAAGFRVERIVFDSDEFQFYGSELYRRDIPLRSNEAHGAFSRREIAMFRARAAELNRKQLGDQAAFSLTTDSSSQGESTK